MHSKEMYELKKQLKFLQGVKGQGTELISVYIPPEYPIADVSNKLKNEYGQASNIKSKTTRKNVLDALEKIIQYLKTFRKPPDSGIAIFCGNISDVPGKPDVELYFITPPEPVSIQVYRCDSKFFLEPLEGLFESKDSFGLIVMDGKEATIAHLKGKRVIVLKKLNSTAHSKIRKGGQSARRYERLIEESIELYYKRIGEALDNAFMNKGIKGVIVGGPGPSKENFVKMKPFNQPYKILGVVDTGYTDEFGIRELLEKAEEILSEQEIIKEKQIVGQFKREVVTDGLAAYGYNDVKEALERGQVKTLLLSEDLGYRKVKTRCSQCSKEEEHLLKEEGGITEACECNGKKIIFEEKEVAEELADIAEQKGIGMEFISSETVEGGEFLLGFHGIGAFLKYKI